MKYAKFSDEFLSYFRLDDNGKTLVLTDKQGYTRAVKLLTYEERPQGEWIANPLGDYVCNKCSWVVGKFERNFCPNCGVKMKGGAE